MKFAKYLESESIPEWRRAYINYKGLKKKLKAVEKFRKASERRAAIELERALQGLDTDSDPDRPIYKTDTTTEWHWPWRTSEWHNSDGSGNSLRRQPSFPHSLIRKLSSRFQNDDTELSRVRSRPASIQSTTTLSVLEEVLLHASEPERAFFKMLNGESEKVSRFYDEKESEARAKLEALKIQMQLIAEYGRRLIETGRNNNGQQQHAIPPQNAYHHHGIFNGLFHRNRPEEQPTLHLPHMPASIDYTADQHVSYNVARSRLKKALTEFYRSLEFLRSYKLLNETGFRKILKKFDKTAGWKASDLYLQRLKKYHWMTSVDLNNIIRETESLYFDEFADGHRRRGMRKLRVPEKHEDYHSTTLRIGLYLGIALPLLVHACQLGFDPKTIEYLPNIHTNLQIYACLLLPILFSLGFAIDLIIWHCYRISYKFIFELDPRHNLDYHQFGELPALLFAIASFIMYIDFSQTFAPSIPSELCPLILFFIILAIILCPFNILYFSARKWFGVALGRIFLSYCFRVEFRDFFIADELNSLSYSFWTLSYFFCAYGWHWNDLELHCNVPYMWITPVIASLPPWWRFLQCLRRYKDSEEKVHLVNGAKYLSSIMATVVSAVRRIRPSAATEALLVLTCTFNSCYTSLWDIKMDWGLLQPCSKNFMLRDELVFKKRIYYAATVIDVLLRFAWTINFAGLAVNGQVLSFVIALLEAYRRIQWNVFRLENEHLNNCGQYRAIKEIPLPFAMRENVKSLGDEEEGSIQLPVTNHNTATVPIPIANADNDLMMPVSRHNSRYSHRDSIYSGSFYGRRDFENRHERTEETKEAKSLQQPVSTIENVLTHIRSNFGTAGSDGSDSEHDDNDDDDDDNNDEMVNNMEP